ncbi:uncharacterized protein ycf45 isoform X2 [Coffea arabica]|uniref:Uncharacterized protein ycf45 isoform X2 n=1 Tax=Coffea arabica TaxID=13443 RepID=A0A6P6US01_COFAR|nr:uncharacterized protein ycf45-like isoform X2 [Coffea arabica]
MVATTEGREMEIMGMGVGVGAASSLKNKNHPTTHALPLAPLQLKLLNGGYAAGTPTGKKHYTSPTNNFPRLTTLLQHHHLYQPFTFTSSASTNLNQVLVRDDDDDDIHALFQILPCDLRNILMHDSKQSQLLEVILDLGKLPQACYAGDFGRQVLRDTEVTIEELEYAQNAIGQFGDDNRAGIVGTLHRISAIRSRKGQVIGLTCRVGRAIQGHVSMVRDLLDFSESILFVGRPGVGKTTVMRELSRVLSHDLQKRVVVVDTSNEIGGDGDVPHPAIGSARRLQVPEPSMQHLVMIEAVENHMPEVIIIDEIGTESEVNACRTIAERGVMLVGTAHGEGLENIVKNPILVDLIGGVKSVTLGDQEARVRNSKKIIFERVASPTFPFLVEVRERDYWAIHREGVWMLCFVGGNRSLRLGKEIKT